MKFLQCILFFFFVLGYSQDYSKVEKTVLTQAKKLDSLMKNNDESILEFLLKTFLSVIQMAGFRIWMILKKISLQKKLFIQKSTRLKFQKLKCLRIISASEER